MSHRHFPIFKNPAWIPLVKTKNMQKKVKSLTRLFRRRESISCAFYPWFFESSDSDTFWIRTSMSSLAIFRLFNSSKIIMISSWRRIRHLQRCSPCFTPLIVVPWHCILWCTWCSSEPGDGYFFNRASTFSCTSQVCSRFTWKEKMPSHMAFAMYLHYSHNMS